MKKLILCLSVASIIGVTYKIATAEEPAAKTRTSTASTDADRYIVNTYNNIDFGKGEKLSLEAFSAAYRGYLNLRNAGKLNDNKQILTIADMSLSSRKHRLWIIDIKSNKILLNDYVAHGQGSGDEFAVAFSNTNNSHQSSLGFYVTGETYVGDHGNSLRLHGMDNGYNSAAYDRAIVVHGADYVCPEFVAGQKRLGRSWGCPAVSNKVIGKVINYIKDGTCLFVYYPQKKYMANSTWLNKKIDRLPEDHMIQDMFQVAMNGKKRDTIYEYVTNEAMLQQPSPVFASATVVKNPALAALNLNFIRKIMP